MRRSSCRDASRSIALVKPASTRGNAAPCSMAARLARAMIAQVVEVHAQHHDGAFASSDGRHHVHQLGLAVVAAVDAVAPVGSALHLVRGDRRPTQAPLAARAARHSASSSPASDGETAVTAWALSPSTRCATAARNAESAPPLNATTTRPRSRRISSSRASAGAMVGASSVTPRRYPAPATRSPSPGRPRAQAHSELATPSVGGPRSGPTTLTPAGRQVRG